MSGVSRNQVLSLKAPEPSTAMPNGRNASVSRERAGPSMVFSSRLLLGGPVDKDPYK